MIPLKASHTRVSYGSMTGRGESLRVNSPKTMSRLVEGGGAGASLEGITFLRQPNFGRKDLHTYLTSTCRYFNLLHLSSDQSYNKIERLTVVVVRLRFSNRSGQQWIGGAVR